MRHLVLLREAAELYTCCDPAALLHSKCKLIVTRDKRLVTLHMVTLLLFP